MDSLLADRGRGPWVRSTRSSLNFLCSTPLSEAILQVVDRVVVELAHHVERRPVLGVLVPLTLDAPRHHAHHPGAIRERNASEELDRELLRVIRLRSFVHALVEPREIAEGGLDVVRKIAY